MIRWSGIRLPVSSFFHIFYIIDSIFFSWASVFFKAWFTEAPKIWWRWVCNNHIYNNPGGNCGEKEKGEETTCDVDDAEKEAEYVEGNVAWDDTPEKTDKEGVEVEEEVIADDIKPDLGAHTEVPKNKVDDGKGGDLHKE